MLQAVEHFLARVEGGDVVVVNDGDHRQPHQRYRAQVRQMRHTVELDFEWNRDLLLDFFGGVARPLRDDLRVGVGNVGIGFDRQIVKGNDAPDEEHERPAQHEQGVVQREVDGLADH